MYFPFQNKKMPSREEMIEEIARLEKKLDKRKRREERNKVRKDKIEK